LGRLECRKSQVGLCQGTAKLFVELRSSVGGCVGRPTLAGNLQLSATHLNNFLEINYLGEWN